jgi:hypothetical protein
MDRKWEELPNGRRRHIFGARLSDIQSAEVIEYRGDRNLLITGLLRRIRRDVPEAVITADRRQLGKDIRRLAERIQRALARDRLIEFIETYHEWRRSVGII